MTRSPHPLSHLFGGDICSLLFSDEALAFYLGQLSHVAIPSLGWPPSGFSSLPQLAAKALLKFIMLLYCNVTSLSTKKCLQNRT